MKKVVLAIAALCIGFAAKAQVVIGGNLGFGLSNSYCETTKVVGSNTTTSDWDGPRTFNFDFTPKIGYQLNERVSLGVLGGYSVGQNKLVTTTPPDGSDWTDYKSSTTTTKSSWSVAPYMRYAAAHYGNLSFFVEFSVPFVWNLPDRVHTDVEYMVDGNKTHEKNTLDDPVKSFSWGITMVPGFNYALNEHCSLDLYVDVFKLAYHSTKITDFREGEDWSTEVITHQNDFNFGVFSLANSSMLRLGFNYTF